MTLPAKTSCYGHGLASFSVVSVATAAAMFRDSKHHAHFTFSGHCVQYFAHMTLFNSQRLYIIVSVQVAYKETNTPHATQVTFA